MKTKYCVYCGREPIDFWTGHVVDKLSDEWITAGWCSRLCQLDMEKHLPTMRYERRVKDPVSGCFGYWEFYMGRIVSWEDEVFLPPELFEI